MQTENRSQKIAVTGATGRLGPHVVEVLEQRGHEVVQIARSKGVDVVSGEGLDEALAGVETIVDTASQPSPDQGAATAFFTASARNLQRAGAAAGAKRIVVVSIIGVDKFEGGFYAAKVAQEQALLEGPLPVRIVRAATFHEYVEEMVGWTIQDGVAHLPEWRVQLVAAHDVAEALADAAEEPEVQNGRITEVAGPREQRLADVAAALFASRGDSFEIRESRGGPLAEPDHPDAAAFAEGATLPNPGAKLAGPSYEEWLAAAASTTSNVSPRQDTYWWGGSVMEIKARAEDTGGALGVAEGRFFEEGYGPPLHVHSREDEAMYVLEGQIRFRVGDDEFVGGPGTWLWQPRGVPHTFRVESDGARVLFIFTPGGIERMFEEGGVPAGESAEPPQQEYDLEAAAALAKRYGFEVVGPLPA